MSSTSGKLPADCNVVGSSADGVATEVSRICFANDFIFYFDYLPTHFSSSTFITFQITHGTASSSGEPPADRNVSASAGGNVSAEASDGANASAKVRYMLHLSSIVFYCYSFGNLSPFDLAQICS